MSGYIHFTEEQKQQANAVDLEWFLRSRGEKLLTSGRDKRMASDHSITIRGNAWYDHAAQQGGHAISFVQRYCCLSYPDAVSLLLHGSQAYPAAVVREEPPPKPFILPPEHSDLRRVYAYLTKHRGIDGEVVSFFARRRLLYEDAVYHNAVFVGTDENGIPRHAHKRSTNSSGKALRLNVEGSDPRCSFHHIGTPIDLLSYITLHPEDWEKHGYAACCGTSFLPVEAMLERLSVIRQVYLCLDNDEAGHAASRRMMALLEDRGIQAERLIPEHKDWNDDLLRLRTQEQEVTPCSPAHGFC